MPSLKELLEKSRSLRLDRHGTWGSLVGDCQQPADYSQNRSDSSERVAACKEPYHGEDYNDGSPCRILVKSKTHHNGTNQNEDSGEDQYDRGDSCAR